MGSEAPALPLLRVLLGQTGLRATASGYTLTSHVKHVKPVTIQAKRIKTAQVNLRMAPALKAAAEKAAADDGRSLTSFVEKLLGDFLKRKGYLPPS